MSEVVWPIKELEDLEGLDEDKIAKIEYLAEL